MTVIVTFNVLWLSPHPYETVLFLYRVCLIASITVCHTRGLVCSQLKHSAQ